MLYTQTSASVRCPSLSALSYCWGESFNKLPISVDGRVVGVTSNLHAALTRLRSDGVESIWIDALCINQDDKEERSIQVGRMGTIYKQAKMVIIWLGEAEKISDSDITELNSVSHETVPSINAFLAAAQLLSKVYWSRVWIIQELAAASSITILCGAYSILWESLCQMLPADLVLLPSRITSYPRHAHGIIEFYINEITMFHKICAFREDRQAREPVTLIDALYRSQHTLSTDPKDKLYALLGLAFDGTNFVPHPNYGRTKEDVYRDFSSALFDNRYHLDFIYLRSISREVYGALPSWAVDWSDLNDDLARRQFQQLLGIKSQSPAVLQSPVTVDGNTLTVTGFIIGTILKLTSSFEADETDGEAGEDAVKVELYMNWPKRVFECLLQTTPDQIEPIETAIPTRGFPILPERGGLVNMRLNPTSLQKLALWLHKNTPSFTFSGIINFQGSLIQYSGPELLHNFGVDEVNCSCDLADTILGGMRLAVLKEGLLAWVPKQTRKGDIIVRINGCMQPVVLRENERNYRVVGAAKVSSRDNMSEDDGEVQQFGIV
jgi:hypothetical protein